MRAMRLAAASAAAVLGFCPLFADAAVGRTPGAFAASPTGAATYSVPLWAPPGIGTLAPALRLEYSSHQGAGLAGIGWSVAGLSAITRCPQTVAQDGVYLPPDLSAGDRFCLDGQRLRLTAGAYGADGSTYATEIESYARITARGVAGSGPAWFTVEHADGRVSEYGSTADSRGEPAPAVATARHWALAQVRDRSGNSLRYTYTDDPVTGQHRLARIEYPFTATGGGPYYRIEFATAPRATGDVQGGYAAGYPWRETQRLARILVQADQGGWKTVRRYELAHESGPGGVTRLASLTECDGGTDCLRPTTFRYRDRTPGWLGEQVTVLAPAPLDASQVLWLRTGAGGGDDLVYQSVERDQFWLAPGGIGTPVAYGPGTTTVARGDLRPGDIDGDGRDDLSYRVLQGANTSIRSMRATGTGFAPAALVATLGGNRQFLLADIDGDGRDELLHWVSGGNTLAYRTNSGGVLGSTDTVLYTAPLGHVLPANALAVHAGPQRNRSAVRRADFGGDAREDLVLMTCPQSAPACSASAASFRVLLASPPNVPAALVERASFTAAAAPLLADVNGDGLTDLAYVSGIGVVQLRFGTGSGVAAELDTGTLATPFGQALVVDANSDGRTDLLYPSGTRWNLLTSTGSGWSAAQITNLVYATGQARSVFVPDPAWATGASTGYVAAGRLRRNDAVVLFAADGLLGVTDGNGVGASDLEYVPLVPEYLPAMVGRRIPLPRWLLRSAAHTDGTGTDQRILTYYDYQSPRIDRNGRGFLGFARVTAAGLDAFDIGAVASDTEYHQDFPLTGRVKRARQLAPSGAPVSELELQYATLLLGGGSDARVYPYVATRTRREWEVSLMGSFAYNGGPFLTQTELVAAIDPTSGLVTDATTTTTAEPQAMAAGSSHSRRVLHTAVLDDLANWCLGRPQATQVTQSHTLPGGAALTRRAAASWDAAKCRPTEFRSEPGDANWQVVATVGYDAFGNVAQQAVTGAGLAARTTSFSYGSRGQFIEAVTNAMGAVERYAWRTDLGQPQQAIDANGLVTTWSHDGFGRQVATQRPDGTRTRLDRLDCAAGACPEPNARTRLVISELDDTGAVFRSDQQVFDRYDRAIAIEPQTATGGRTTVVRRFDTRGRLQRQDLPAPLGSPPPGHVAYEYDERDRVVAETRVDASGQAVAQQSHEHRGADLTVIDAAGRRTTQVRGAAGEVLQTFDALGNGTSFEYDAFGSLLQVRDATGQAVAAMTYGPRGQKVSQWDADTGNWAWQLNALGEVTALRAPGTAAPAWTTTFAYDALGRPTSRTEAEGTSSWTWGTSAAAWEIGQLIGIDGPGYSESRRFDRAGRLLQLQITTDATYRYDYAYNAQGALETLAYPETAPGSRLQLRHEYAYGELAAVRDAAQPATVPWRLQATDAAGHVVSELLGNRVAVTSVYDPLQGVLTSRAVQTSSGAQTPGTVLAEHRYDWDAVDNLVKRADVRRGLTETFGYDLLDRLVQAQLNGVESLAVAYDAIGNITRKSDVGDYTYHATRRHALLRAGAHAFSYDAGGQVVSRDGATIAWTSSGQPRSLVDASGAASQFWHRPDRMRFKQVSTTAGVAEETQYIGGLLEKITRGSRIEWRHYVPAPTGVAAVYVRRSDGTADTFYLTHDHLGGTQLVLDAAGAVVKVEEGFDAFGRRRGTDWRSAPTSADWAAIGAVTRDGFTGHEHLDPLGLVHMNGRVYDPVVARFLSADPIVQAPLNGQSYNRYAYAFNNPLSLVDPSGFQASPADGWSVGPAPSSNPPVDYPDNAVIFWFTDGSYNIIPNFNRGMFCTGECIAHDRAWEARYLGQAYGLALGRRIASDPGAAARPVIDFIVGAGIQLWVDSVRVQGAEDVVEAINLLFPIPDSPEGFFGADMAPIVAMAVTHRPAPNGALSALTKSSLRGAVVIGENMAARVKPFARSIGGTTVDDWLAGRKWTQALNDEFIKAVKELRRVIVDIGPDTGRRLRNRIDARDPRGRGSSTVYGNERRELEGYDLYHPAFRRSGRFEAQIEEIEGP